jgi:hypothetical protein
MIHLEAVSKNLLRLLRRLMDDAALQSFSLVGGTALALRFGHRESMDLDLFTDRSFDAPRLAEHLIATCDLQESETSENTVRGVIGGIKTDFLAHRYPLLGEVEILDGIRMFSLPDLAAMKLNAIANRGSKKDFWDYCELLDHFTRDQMLSFCERKYRGDSVWNVQKSLSFFDDADLEPDPRDLRGRSWDSVKRTIAENNRL